MPRIYEDIGDGWQEINSKGFRLSCCDCGLTHIFKIRKRESGYEIKVDRDNRATALLRRHNDHPCKPE